MDEIELKKIRKIAEKIARKAGGFLSRNMDKIKNIYEKSPREYVTDIDKKSEDIIVSALKKKFPKHEILAEEGGKTGKKSEFLWLVDSLDGTHDYMAGLPTYGVSLALCLKGEVLIGVIYLPHLDKLYSGQKGRGAYLNGKRISVSRKSLLKESFVFMQSAFHKKAEEKIATLRLLAKEKAKLRILGPSAFQLAYVGEGKADGLVSFTGRPWDYAAGALIIQEAGGRVTNFKGEKWSVRDEYLIAANGKIHGQILKLISKK